MRKLVITILIMLPAVLFPALSGSIEASSVHPTIFLHEVTPQTSRIPLIMTHRPTSCTNTTASRTPSLDHPLTTTDDPIVLENPILMETEKTVASVVEELPTEILIPSNPIASQTALPTEQSVNTPTPSAGSSGGLNAEVIFGMVNAHRTNAGLPPFQKHPDVCAVAESRRPELENEIFGNSYIHAGFQARQLPFHATENMISQQTEEAAVNWWLNSSIHRSALFGSTPYACVACQGKVCAMIFAHIDSA